MRHGVFPNGTLTALALAAIAGMTAIVPLTAHAQSSGLAGNWSGTGRIVLASGDTERGRCRVNIRRRTSRTFNLQAVCATPSIRVEQVASVHQISATRFEGRFYNREYDITGSIRIWQRGNRLSARLTNGGATGTLSLRR